MEIQRAQSDPGEHHRHSHLFTVRLWSEAMGNDRTEWRGQVRYVPSGETRYFRDWSTLATLFLAMLPGTGAKENPSAED